MMEEELLCEHSSQMISSTLIKKNPVAMSLKGNLPYPPIVKLKGTTLKHRQKVTYHT